MYEYAKRMDKSISVVTVELAVAGRYVFTVMMVFLHFMASTISCCREIHPGRIFQ